MCLDESLDFSYHVKKKMSRVKGICIIKKLSKTLPWHSLITIYKSFVSICKTSPWLWWYLPKNENLSQKIERIQYHAVLAITGTVKGTYPLSKSNKGLGFESFKFSLGLGN